MTDTRSNTYFVQPADWTELDSDWADRFDTLDEAQTFMQSGEQLALWTLRWQNGAILRLS
jgi:hypothetical protein